MTINARTHWLDGEIRSHCGCVALDPMDPVTAGAYGTWTITFTAGSYGMDIGSTFKLAFRLASDWGQPQLDIADQPNYTTVWTSSRSAVIKAHFDEKGHVRPWSFALVLDITEDALEAGETVTIVLGDRAFGSPGMQAQTFVDETFEFQALVDPFGTGCFVQLPDRLALPVRAGPVARFQVLAPATVAPGSPLEISVRALDRFGNPATDCDCAEPLRLVGPADYGAVDVALDAHGVARIPWRAQQPGVLRFTLVGAQNVTLACSNPVLCSAVEPAGHRLYFGDIHGQSGETVGTGTVAHYFAFARDMARLDFAAHAANDFQITGDHYADIQRQVRETHRPGAFVTFLAYEWSGNTPAGGDHNVYFLHDDEPIHRSSHWQIEDWQDQDSDRPRVDDIYRQYHGRPDVLVIPHVGGRRANLAFHDPDLSPFVEICSVHGRFEWFGREALDRGLQVGFVANSDDHTARPGAAFPSELDRGRGGLMAAWADDLSREALWQAFRARRVYGTSGERIALQFTADGHPMGAAYETTAAPRLRVAVWGTAGIERLEIWQGSRLWHTHRPAPPSPASGQLRIAWTGARSAGRNRRLIWDGTLTAIDMVFGHAQTCAFDTPCEGIQEASADRIRFTSSTVGDPDGLVLEVGSLGPDARVRFDSAPLSAEIALADLATGECILPAAGLDAELRVAWMPESTPPTDVTFEIAGDLPESGVTPYWVKVLQVDGEAAWSSPIYIRRGPFVQP